ncbi:shikimate dehydrogenase [Streptomyces sp. NK08204]|uniref:shikimate dehydrogenase family protein n=1 Tax=Streptomyces sp. NK08204 TaxID=2873260 RepID=UPI001CEDD8B7|nr:shikimate dehydrogenase [Streptomyces sp. NK08204]
MREAAEHTPDITGRTRLLAVLGDPVEQVRAPTMLNPVLRALGVDAVLVPVHVRPEDLGDVMRGLRRTANLDGLLVTVPHKTNVLRYADVRSRAAEIAGSANALRREPDGSWHADNFDGAGFLAGLTAAGHRPEGKQVTVVGSGGAGTAVAAALLGAGVAHLTLHDTDGTRARQAAERLDGYWPGRVTATAVARVGEADIMVNATPLGLRPEDPLPFDPATARPGTLVADIIMKPRETRLLRKAAGRGLPVHFGAPMLDHQLDLYCAYFGFRQAP